MNAVVVTGATSGIGLETARLLAAKGYRVLGVGRARESCARACADICATVPDAAVRFYEADLMRLREVLRVSGLLRADLETDGDRLCALINNAGCARGRYMTTEDGYEQQFALNYLCGYLLTRELLPQLLRAGGRVMMTASRSHFGARVRWDDVMQSRGYNPLTAYKQSKLCDVLLARGLNDRYAARGLRAYAVDPGLVRTEIGNKAGGAVGLVWSLRKRHGVSPETPARTYAFLCEPERHPAGLYYYRCMERACSREVSRENADRLFALSERLCGPADGEVRA